MFQNEFSCSTNIFISWPVGRHGLMANTLEHSLSDGAVEQPHLITSCCSNQITPVMKQHFHGRKMAPLATRGTLTRHL